MPLINIEIYPSIELIEHLSFSHFKTHQKHLITLKAFVFQSIFY
jgi:hypothetical protein